jgi:hypothetical protein
MICSTIGLTVVVVFGLLYLFGLNQRYDVDLVTRNWDRPAGEYWRKVRGREAEGYSWFLSDLPASDSLSMLGIAVLSLVPLIGVFALILRADPLHRILLILLAVEFLYAILHPLLHMTP